MKIYHLIILTISSAMFGCAAPSQLLIHPTTGQQVKCATFGFGWLGTPIALANYSQCVDRYKALGYVNTEEYWAKEPPKFETIMSQPVSPCLRPIWTENTEWNYSSSSPDGRASLKVLGRGSFKEIPVYVVVGASGKQLMINESLGLCALVNQGNTEKEFSPPVNLYDWPLSVGKTWESHTTVKTPTGSVMEVTLFEVKGYGKVKVPAGLFDAYHIVSTKDLVLTGQIRISETWYSPEVQYYVKMINYTTKGKTIQELVNFKKGTKEAE